MLANVRRLRCLLLVKISGSPALMATGVSGTIGSLGEISPLMLLFNLLGELLTIDSLMTKGNY